jgi:integrase/recombinase XerD
MMTKLFPNSETRDWLASGSSAPFVRAYAADLEERLFKFSTIRQRVRAAAHLGHWLDAQGIPLRDLDEVVLSRFEEHLALCDCPRSRGGAHWHTHAGSRHFLAHLRVAGVVPLAPVVIDPKIVLRDSFFDWLRKYRGVGQTTLVGYRGYVTAFLGQLGADPGRYEVSTVRQFIITCSRSHGAIYAKKIGSVLRMFFRFLAAEERCSPDLIDTVPKTAAWRLADIPRHVSATNIERVVAVSKERSRCGLRDRAVVLLLARLGLRAQDVATLCLSDIDWARGRVRVMGKGRRETWLPLPQDAGDALLEYIDQARPRVLDERVFLRVRAPICGLGTSGAVVAIARQAIQRAGIERPAGVGSHLFRHSLAKRLLEGDVPLAAIGVVLRHRSLETSAQYSKIDTKTLGLVVQSWPTTEEVAPC